MSQPSSNGILQKEDTDKTEINVNNMYPAKDKSLKIKVWSGKVALKYVCKFIFHCRIRGYQCLQDILGELS